MYSNNNTNSYSQTTYQPYGTYQYGYENQNDDRFAGGLLAPLFLGGVAGYAIGYNRPNYNQGYVPAPVPYPYPAPMYTNNYYYPYY